MRPPIILPTDLFNARVKALVDAGGDNVKAGVSLEEVADLIYTRRMVVSPEVAGPPKEPKTKGAKKPKIEGSDNIDKWCE